MSLQFILGNSGSGKSDRVYRQIVEEAASRPTASFLILVPEQFTMQTQQKLVELAPNHAIMNIDILSFKRLAYRVFDDLGLSNLNVLEETGKNLILRRLAEEKKEELTVLKKNLNRMGYIGEIKSFISELVQYDISPDQLEAYSKRTDISETFAAKLRDIVVMYRSFQNYLQGKYITAEEILTVLIRVADQSELLKNCYIVFDEFTGFTPIQNKLMRKLMNLSQRIQIILTLDEKVDPAACCKEHDLFYMTGKTVAQMTRLAQELHVEILPPQIYGQSEKMRFAHSPDLAFLERNLFRNWYQVYKEESPHIRMASLRNPREELYLAAREICRLVQEEGYRYREIAIVTGDLETYGNYAEEVCSKYQIPYFMDQTTQLVFHPFIESIRAMLEIVSDNFSYEAIMRFLRSGFSAIDEDTIDRLDNYLLATGIHGKKSWSGKWVRKTRRIDGAQVEELDAVRKEIYALFGPLYDIFHKTEAKVCDYIPVLYDICKSLGAEEKLWELENLFLQEGKQTRSREYGQIFRIFMELLEKFYRLLGEDQMTAEEFSEILDAGLSEAVVAVIPPGYDSVTIGDIERTRLNHIKVLFFLGVNDGIIPKTKNDGGIISEFERQMMQEAKMELAPGAREQAFIQRFYLYCNLTKPSDLLYLSFSRADAQGQALRPSYLVASIGRLFPKVALEEYESVLEEPNYSTPDAAMDYLIRGKQDDEWFALAAYFLRERPEVTQALLEARYQSCQADPLSRVVAESIYNHHLEGSVTRLEQFASCAYAHFLNYGLGLKERETDEFEASDIGNIYHAALLRYSRKVEESSYNWFNIPDGERRDLAGQAMTEAIAEHSNMVILETGENIHQTRRMEEIFQQTVWALTRQVRAGKFIPSEFEVSFRELDSSDRLQLDIGGGHKMYLQGRIDRMDICRENGCCYIKIIDYKSGSKNFDLMQVYQGLSLQLAAYMDYAMHYSDRKHADAQVMPAALFYYNIDDPVIEEEAGEELDEAELEERILQALRPDGLVNSQEEIYRAMDGNFTDKSAFIPVTLKKDGSISDRGSHVATSEEFAIIQKFVWNKMKEAGRQIYEGKIDINPFQSDKKDSCAYCPYSGICGIKGKLPGIKARRMESMKKEEILQAMETYNALKEGQADGRILDE